MPIRTVCLLVALAAAACGTASANTENTRPRLIDFNPWAWLPTSRNRSPSIMDYFFPPSRTPKNSNLQTPSDIPLLPTTVSQPKLPTTLENTPAATTIEERLTTRKSLSTATKSKPTVTATYATATTPPKTKKTTYKTTPAPETTVELKTTSTEKASSILVKEVTATTERPTKHYTIKPIRTTVIPTVEDTETTSDSEIESTETLSDNDSTMTTAAAAENVKESFPTTSAALDGRSTDPATGSTTPSESSTQADTTAADGADSREGYLPLRDKPQQTHVKINEQTKKETVPLPAGSTSVLAKPTKYHYYPHNQHIYLLPECAIQQVCNAVYVRLNYTQPLCACPSRYRDPCSASLNADDLHTTRLTTDSKKKYATKAITLVKTCEAVSEMRECRAPRDWSLLALQNIRTGKSHYLVICRCPEHHILEGPMSHDQPTYASVPGIRVYGMMCVRPTSSSFHSGYNANRFPSSPSVQSTTGAYAQPHSYTDKPSSYNRYPTHSYVGPSYYNRMSRGSRVRRTSDGYPPIPWYKVKEFAHSLEWTE